MAAMQASHDVSAALHRLLVVGTGLPRSAVEELAGKLQHNTRATTPAPVATAVSSTQQLRASPAVEQVLEVLPELGVPFVEACLRALNNEVERVINALLTHELPPELAELDRKTGRPVVVAKDVSAVSGKVGRIIFFFFLFF